MTDRESILEKLRKIKAKAENAAATEAEAKSFAAKMSDLMMEHAIEEHEIGDYKTASRIEKDFSQKYFDKWRRSILSQVGLTCGCAVFSMRYDKQKHFKLFGRPDSVEAAWIMFKYIEEQIVRISRELYPKDVRGSRRAQAGLGIGVAHMLAKHRERDVDNPANLPVILDYDESKEFSNEWCIQNSITVSKAKNTKTKAHLETVVGMQNADRVQLRDQMK